MVDISANIQLFLEYIENAERIVLTTHQKPDGDGLGAICALSEFLRQKGKTPILFSLDPFPQHYNFLFEAKYFVHDPSIFDDTIDMLIVCDAGDLQYVGILPYFSSRTLPRTIINIDHHSSNVRFGTMNIIDEHASSSCEIIWRILQAVETNFSSDMATALLLGIVVDTGHFSNPATNQYSFETAALLLQKGASYKEILVHGLRNQTIEGISLWSKALKRAECHKNFPVMVTYLLYDDFQNSQYEEIILGGMSNFFNNVTGVDATILLREGQKGIIKGSLRTTNVVDVSQIAQIFGGGGHRKSAGFTFYGSIQVDNGKVSII